MKDDDHKKSLLICRIAVVCLLLALSIVVPHVVSGFYGADESSGRLLYGVIFPSLPFVVLCLFALARTQGRFVFSLSALIGATVGALAAIAFPYTLLRYASAHYRGGGANIGLGILFLFLPVYLPVAMFTGGWFARALYLHFWGWRHC
jgi:hypothetical protein